jgi:hypothetical protein
MSTLGASELLQVWERGQSVRAPERGLLLLVAATPGSTLASLGNLPVGARDGRLLALRERLFGRAMVCVTPCPNCGESLEFPVDTRQFSGVEIPQQEISLERDRYQIRFRIPNAADLVACTAEGEVPKAERLLLERCVLEANFQGHPVGADALPPALIEAMSQAMEATDPCADLQVEANCPFCAHRWDSTFDIVSFLWTELQDWAIRMLREIHTLALAYGWSEQDILALSPWRRRLYLQLAGS